MVITVKWDNIDILVITKKHNMYISSIISENIDEVSRAGMPMFLISNINIISKELPNIILDRLPSIDMIKKEIEFVSENLESNILEYINRTGCKRATDKFSFYISK